MKAIKCDYCGETWPEDQPFAVQVHMEMPTYQDAQDQDFCSWACLAKYCVERESQAVAGVSISSSTGGGA